MWLWGCWYLVRLYSVAAAELQAFTEMDVAVVIDSYLMTDRKTTLSGKQLQTKVSTFRCSKIYFYLWASSLNLITEERDLENIFTKF